ncbi:glycoside hydrolase family 95 protein, partial [Rhodopirellula sallentina]
MKKLAILILLTLLFAGNTTATADTLWYEQPGTNPLTSLPIGNGRIGGLIFGGVANEKIVISEDTVWSGGPHDYTNVGSHQYLPELRKRILTEKYEEAAEFGAEHLLGIPKNQKKFQMLANLHLQFPGHDSPQDYRRQLNMSDATATVRYRINDAVFTREIFASHPDDVIAIRIQCDQNHRITMNAAFDSLHPGCSVSAGSPNELVINGNADAIRFQSRMCVLQNGGTLQHADSGLKIKDASSVVIILAAATNYVNHHNVSASPPQRCQRALANASDSSFDELKRRHVADFRSLYDRVQLNLKATPAERETPTDTLLEKVIQGERSALLEERLFQYGRYLNISGARPGTQPLNLVGIWPTEGLDAPWGGKWTLNINAELNTWPVETTALPECHEPLLALLEDLRVTGRRVATEHYGCRGFVAHHNTDLWRGAAPVDTAIHGLWPMGSAWLCRHIWEHYDFSRNRDYLRDAYPTMKEAALFYEDYLIEGPDGHLATCPAISFEQTFRKKDGTLGRLTYAPTMDNQILRDLFSNCIQAAQTLGTDTDKCETWTHIISRLRPNQIDPDTGRIMEWAFQAEQPRVSGQLAPLWGVSPGREINIHDT